MSKRDRNKVLKSVLFYRQGDFVNIQFVIDGITANNYVIDVLYDKLKLGVICKQKGKTLGIINEEFKIPGLKNAEIVDNKVINNVLNIILVERGQYERSNPKIDDSFWAGKSLSAASLIRTEKRGS